MRWIVNSTSNGMNKILQIFKRPDLRNKVLFIFFLLAVSRLISSIPIPAVDVSQLKDFFAQNQFFGLISSFTGGSLSTLSIAMLMTMIFPGLEQMYKYEGEAGRMKFNQYSRLLTVPLAALQGYGFLVLLARQNVIGHLSPIDWATAISVIIAGSVFLMWLGELISEKNLGNGVSLLILAGIVAGFPASIQQTLFTFDASQLFIYAGFIIVALVVIVGVIYISEAQRNIPINYARRVRGMKMYGGVIPIIFALSLLLFPGMIANFFVGSNIVTISKVATFFANFVQNQLWYSLSYFFLVVLFTYFYTAVTFDPKSISENIQKQGGYIPGIRPGPMTAQFLNHLLNRVTLVGAIFLGLIAILPNIVQGATGITTFATFLKFTNFKKVYPLRWLL